MTTTKNYDYLNRLTSISSVPASQTGMSIFYAYAYNAANQRTQVKLNDQSYWIYQYDALGQVTSGKRYWSDGTPVAGQQFEYGFDDIGNRASTKAGGDSTGNNLRPATCSANTLNQYTSRTVPNAADILGIANAGGTVTVNSQSTYRRYEYFDKALTIDNSTAPVWQSVTISATGATPVTGNIWVPKTPENYGFDLDGNQTSDGRWNYTWDAENRLIRMVANTLTGPQQRMDFEYDWQGRRIGKKVWNNTGGTGTPATYLKFLYDGWNLIAELDGNNANAVKRSFIWGLDLSGSEQGAGGVGGLLAIKPASGNPQFVAFDGNGNVTGLIDATTGTTAGNFEYGPFGETIRLAPNANNPSPFRFSTKYQDDESDLVYYGYRYYNPSIGRWLCRDHVEEEGGMNLFGFLANDPVQYADATGLCAKACGVKSIVFRPYSRSFPHTPGGWTLTFTGFTGGTMHYDLRYVFEIKIIFLKDNDHDPLMCRYVQLVQGTASINGTPITKSDRGVPADGQLHLDGYWKTPPGWTDDNIEKHLDLWPLPNGTSYSQTDRPGIPRVSTGDKISYDAVIIGIVKDITRRNPYGEQDGLLTVATTAQWLTASGTVPKLKVSPGKLTEN